MEKWVTIAVLIMCLALTGALACNPFGGDDEVSRQPVEVVRGDLTVSVSGSGKVAVSEDAMLSFGSMGRVERIYVAEGDERWDHGSNGTVSLRSDDWTEVDRTPPLSDDQGNDFTWSRYPNGTDTDQRSDWMFIRSTPGAENSLRVARGP